MSNVPDTIKGNECHFCKSINARHVSCYEVNLCDSCDEKLGELCRQYAYDMHDPL